MVFKLVEVMIGSTANKLSKSAIYKKAKFVLWCFIKRKLKVRRGILKAVIWKLFYSLRRCLCSFMFAMWVCLLITGNLEQTNFSFQKSRKALNQVHVGLDTGWTPCKKKKKWGEVLKKPYRYSQAKIKQFLLVKIHIVYKILRKT